MAASGSRRASALRGNQLVPGLPPYYVNFTRANTARLRAMKAAAIAGTGRGRVLGGMDSFMAGYGATASTTDEWNDTFVGSTMSRVTDFLNAKATPVPSTRSFACSDLGTSNMTNLLSADPRYAYGGSVVPLANYPVLGGIPLRISAAGWIEFTPGIAFDTIDLMVMVNTAAGTLGVSIDHGTTNLQTLNVQDTTKYVRRLSVACPAGSTTVRLTGLTGTPCLVMIGTRNATDRKIEFVNAGMLARKAADINVIPGSVANTDWNWIAGLAPFFDGNAINACLLEAGFNDWNNNGNNSAAAAAQVTTAIQNLQARNVDVVYLTYGNLNVPAWVTGGAQQACISAAIAAGIPVIDARQLMGPFAAEGGISASGWYDNYHMRTRLQDLVAQAVANIFDYL